MKKSKCQQYFRGLIVRILDPYAFWFSYYNHSHNILRILDVFPNFPFTASKTKPDYS